MLAAVPSCAGECRFVRGSSVGTTAADPDLWGFCGVARRYVEQQVLAYFPAGPRPPAAQVRGDLTGNPEFVQPSSAADVRPPGRDRGGARRNHWAFGSGNVVQGRQPGWASTGPR